MAEEQPMQFPGAVLESGGLSRSAATATGGPPERASPLSPFPPRLSTTDDDDDDEAGGQLARGEPQSKPPSQPTLPGSCSVLRAEGATQTDPVEPLPGHPPKEHGKMVSEHICIYTVSGIIVMVAMIFATSTVYMDYNIRVKTVEQQTCYCAPGPACPDGWVGYQGECYNFPDVKKDWLSSQKACSFENASLLTFSYDKEKEFVMRYLYKGTTWLGLSKDPDQLWGWTNGENSTVPKVTGEGDCVYLNKDGNANAAKCTTELYWICNKPDIFNR